MGNSDRDIAPEIELDMRIADEEIQRRLRERFPSNRYPFMWWELEPGHRTGCVYSGRSPDVAIAKLVHSPVEHRITIETKSGKGPVPASLLQRWTCTCGATSGDGWKAYKVVQDESGKHTSANTRIL